MKNQILFTIAFFLLLSVSNRTFAQSISFTWEDFVEQMADENDEEYSVDPELFEQLLEMHSHPLNINTISKEDLMVLPFLSERKADDIIAYVQSNGEMASLGELMFINSISKEDRDKLRLFITAEPVIVKEHVPSLDKLLKYASHEAVMRSDIPFYTKAGYRQYADSVLIESPNKVYLGNRFHHSFRYSLSSMNRIFAGVQMDKDAGEHGVDHWAWYAMVKNLGVVHRAIVGNYRISFGQGLAINTAAKFGKMMMLSQTGRMDAGISKHSSTAEYGFLSGGAATLRVGGVLVSAFASYRKGDGTYRNDSLGMSSLKTDGLHRTQLEASKKGNLGITNIGGNVHWGNGIMQASATIVATHLSVPLAPAHNTNSTLYRLYNAQGDDFAVASIAYGLRLKSIAFTGETALSNAEGFLNAETNTRDGRQTGWATLNTLRWQMNSSNALTIIGRMYGAKFVSLNGKAFGENSAVQNEQGIFVGWSSRWLRHVKIDTYADWFHFPWLKYQVSNKSYGMEGMAQAEYTPSNCVTLLMRYRIKTKERDYSYVINNDKLTQLRYKTNQNFKLQLNCAVAQQFSLRTQLTGVFTHFEEKDEKGFSIAENIRWQHPSSKTLIDFGIAYFDTDSYDARVYAYEPSLLYSFGFTSYYYQGIRATLLASVPIVKDSLFLTAKLGATHYLNKETIGTGLEQINANHREDLQVQLRWKM